MVLLMYHASPAEFLDDYFQHTRDQNSETPIAIRVIDTRERMAMIPLLMYPHPEFLLDANLNLYSTRYTRQKSCMGVFGKYSSGTSHNRGMCIAAHNSAIRTGGLATAKFDEAGGTQIDGFAHPHFPAAWDQPLQATLSLCKSQHRCCRAEVARRDADKLAKIEKLGFRITPQQSAGFHFAQNAKSYEHDQVQLIIELPPGNQFAVTIHPSLNLFCLTLRYIPIAPKNKSTPLASQATRPSPL